ncbi:MAG: hypothetical protein QM621_08980 [Aeromicrobium sp.]|uniref:hypothetical protein n=1 Tax=Aeromicrobium sp. TaxID=1871063 RepID=UPI0039E2D619
MSDPMPVAAVPESVWLRAMAQALDPDAEPADEALVPEDLAEPEAWEDDLAEVEEDDSDDPDSDDTGLGDVFDDPFDTGEAADTESVDAEPADDLGAE